MINNDSPLKNLTSGLAQLKTYRLAQSAIQDQQEVQYRKALKDYQNKSFSLTEEEIESLILSVAQGRNKFAHLKSCIPRLTSETFIDYLSDSPALLYEPKFWENTDKLYSSSRIHYFKFISRPTKFNAPYYFKDSDSFELTTAGLNTLRSIQKELELLNIAKNSLAYARYATFAAIVGVIISILALFR